MNRILVHCCFGAEIQGEEDQNDYSSSDGVVTSRVLINDGTSVLMLYNDRSMLDQIR